ncbi:hypothetical protein RB594_007041 [Gaeumannomyces avenae]
MRASTAQLAVAGLLALGGPANAAPAKSCGPKVHPVKSVQLGPRPYWLVDNMEDGPLKRKLDSCKELQMKPSKLSIAHRGGGTLQIPEETRESILAGSRMGSGIQECDVAFTSDEHLVCRHSHCDLHTTTNIVTIPELNAKCTQPFQPADPATGKVATAKCCTSDITLADFKRLCGKMDASNPSAKTPAEFLGGTPSWRTDLYARECGTLLTHKEFIALTDALGLEFTPELKTPEVPMPFKGGDFTQERFAQKMIDEYKEAGIAPARVWPQSFRYADVLYWLRAEPEFARQAVLLDESADADPTRFPESVANLTLYAAAGVKVIAPPLPYLVTVGGADGRSIVPSPYATEAKRLGLQIITWTLERSAWLGDGSGGGYYYTTIGKLLKRDGDVFKLLDVLVRDIGAIGVFTDWSATVTYYANCFGYV